MASEIEQLPDPLGFLKIASPPGMATRNSGSPLSERRSLRTGEVYVSSSKNDDRMPAWTRLPFRWICCRECPLRLTALSVSWRFPTQSSDSGRLEMTPGPSHS